MRAADLAMLISICCILVGLWFSLDTTFILSIATGLLATLGTIGALTLGIAVCIYRSPLPTTAAAATPPD